MRGLTSIFHKVFLNISYVQQFRLDGIRVSYSKLTFYEDKQPYDSEKYQLHD